MNHTIFTKLRLTIFSASLMLLIPVSYANDDHDHSHKEEKASSHNHDSESKKDKHDHENGHKEEHDHESEKSHKEKHGHSDKHEHKDEDSHEDEAIKLTDNDLKDFKIELSKAEVRSLDMAIDVTGEVEFNPNKVVHVNPIFRGITKKVKVSTGDKVVKGQILAILTSTSTFERMYLRAPISGTVIQKHISQGEVVSPEHTPFTIADTSEVWVKLSVFQKDLPSIKKGQKAVVMANFESENNILGSSEIFFISYTINEKTRSSIAKIKLNNPDDSLRPGMFVVGKIYSSNKKDVLTIPKSSIQEVSGKKVVFVKSSHGLEFKPQAVKLGNEDEYLVEVREGIAQGATVVANGSFVLKAQLEKGSLGHGHVH